VEERSLNRQTPHWITLGTQGFTETGLCKWAVLSFCWLLYQQNEKTCGG